MALAADHLPSWRVGLPLGILILALALYVHPQGQDLPVPYSLLLGIAGAVLFVRLARWEGLSADLWSGLALVAYFLPALLLGVLWGLCGLLLLGGAFTARVLTGRPPGGNPVR
jgi:hypothetical protein